jgi:hypothetical protein
MEKSSSGVQEVEEMRIAGLSGRRTGTKLEDEERGE